MKSEQEIHRELDRQIVGLAKSKREKAEGVAPDPDMLPPGEWAYGHAAGQIYALKWALDVLEAPDVDDLINQTVLTSPGTPTSDPGVEGCFFRDGDTLRMSLGPGSSDAPAGRIGQL